MIITNALNTVDECKHRLRLGCLARFLLFLLPLSGPLLRMVVCFYRLLPLPSFEFRPVVRLVGASDKETDEEAVGRILAW